MFFMEASSADPGEIWVFRVCWCPIYCTLGSNRLILFTIVALKDIKLFCRTIDMN